MKSTSTQGGRLKQLRISTVLDVWVENESQRPKNEDPPPSKSLINSSKRLSRPEICKKQQDLQLFNKFPEQVWVLTSSYVYIKGFQNTYLDLAGELCSHVMRNNAKANTADFDFWQESLAKVLTNQSAPFTEARFQNKNKVPRCIKVGNGPLKYVFKRLAASSLSFLFSTMTAWIVLNSLKLFTKPVVGILSIFSLVKQTEGFMAEN